MKEIKKEWNKWTDSLPIHEHVLPCQDDNSSYLRSIDGTQFQSIRQIILLILTCWLYKVYTESKGPRISQHNIEREQNWEDWHYSTSRLTTMLL